MLGAVRHPAVILMDELAHINVQGSRHPKRWQDIDELLDAGIDVITTVNVQHLESLNDVVGSITGIRVRETVPDPFFDSADEVVLVDLPLDDLRQRLKEGKVYVGARAERAIENFFRKGNLFALRGVLMALLLCILVTSWLLAGFDTANGVMIYLLAVVIIALRYGRWPSVIATVMNILAFDPFSLRRPARWRCPICSIW